VTPSCWLCAHSIGNDDGFQVYPLRCTLYRARLPAAAIEAACEAFERAAGTDAPDGD